MDETTNEIKKKRRWGIVDTIKKMMKDKDKMTVNEIMSAFHSSQLPSVRSTLSIYTRKGVFVRVEPDGYKLK
jgi:hypothetical protein